MRSQSIDPTVEIGILLACSGSCQELCLTPMQHVLPCTTVQAGDVNARRRLSLAVLVCDNHMHVSSRRWAESRLRGRVRAVDQSLQSLSKSLQLENPLAAWSKEGHSVDCSVHPMRQSNSSTFEENEDSSNSGISSSGSGSRVSVDESVTTSEDDLENNTQ